MMRSSRPSPEPADRHGDTHGVHGAMAEGERDAEAAHPYARLLALGGVALICGAFDGDVVLPTAGEWKVQVSLRTTEFDNPVRSVTFRVP